MATRCSPLNNPQADSNIGFFIAKMWFLTFLLMAAAVLYAVARRPRPWLTRGKRLQARFVEIEQQRFYLEEVGFADYHQALHNYFYLIPQFNERHGLRQVKYNYLDWTDTILQFDDCTLQLVRRIDKIRLIKSENPLSIEQFERLVAKLG